MLTWVNSYKRLIQYFRLSVVMATNQNEEFVQLLCAWWRTTQQTFIKTFCQNTCSEIAIQTYFHFPHYKSVETLCCRSNESPWATAIKTKFLHRLMLWIFLQSFSFMPLMVSEIFVVVVVFLISFRLPWQSIKFRGLDKIHMFDRGLLKEHFWNIFWQKYMQWDRNKGLLSLFQL